MPQTQNTTARLVLLIDADNISPDYMPIILREISALGTLTVKRLYGHFASPSMKSWNDLVHEYALTPVHVPPAATRKNATDMKLAIEAMDLLHRGQVEGFCIASSDSDFTTLASRIREDGLLVYGFGAEKASKGYVNSCDRFFYCDVLLREATQPAEVVGALKQSLPVDDVLSALDTVSGDDGWASLGELGNVLGKRKPDFDPRNHGFRKLSDLLQAIGQVELLRPDTPGTGHLRVRRRPSSGAKRDIIS